MIGAGGPPQPSRARKAPSRSSSDRLTMVEALSLMA